MIRINEYNEALECNKPEFNNICINSRVSS
jgi:hypothetical protein